MINISKDGRYDMNIQKYDRKFSILIKEFTNCCDFESEIEVPTCRIFEVMRSTTEANPGITARILKFHSNKQTYVIIFIRLRLKISEFARCYKVIVIRQFCLGCLSGINRGFDQRAIRPPSETQRREISLRLRINQSKNRI
jgi:hypothetical protein